MTNTHTNPSGSPFSWLKWVMEVIFKSDKDVGLYIAAALALVFTAMMAIQAGVDTEGLGALVWLLGQVVIAAGVLIFLFHVLRESPLVRILANVLVGVATVYFLAGVVQLMSNNRLHPPLAQAACLANPFQSGCPLSASYTTVAVEAAMVSDVVDDPEDAPLMAQTTRVTAEGETISEVLILEAPAFDPPAGNAVYIQFAGKILTADVAAVETALVDAGWTVPGDAGGGERTSVAAGLNEIRYFNAGDAEAAGELARSFAEAAPWVETGTIKLRDLSGAGFSPQADHQFEIWTSPM